jgi:hypothetical protein
MPRDACIRTTADDRLREEWPVTADLLALLVEVTSIGVAGQQLKQPLTLPRPKAGDAAAAPREPGQGDRDAAFKKGVSVLAATSKAVSHK